MIIKLVGEDRIFTMNMIYFFVQCSVKMSY